MFLLCNHLIALISLFILMFLSFLFLQTSKYGIIAVPTNLEVYSSLYALLNQLSCEKYPYILNFPYSHIRKLCFIHVQYCSSFYQKILENIKTYRILHPAKEKTMLAKKSANLFPSLSVCTKATSSPSIKI